ncbi:MAG: ABC transporter ATP-binding protein [Bacilli bacterium]
MFNILKYLKPYIVWILIIFITVYVQVVYCDLALPDYMANIINNGVVIGDTSYILNMGFKMILISLLGISMSIITGFLAAKVGASFAKDLRDKTFSKVTFFGNTEIKKFGIASLITRTTNDITQIQMFITIVFRIMIMAPIMGIGGILKITGRSDNMAWIIALGVFLLLLLIVILVSIVMPKFKIIQKLTDKLNLVTRENLTGMMVIRAFNTKKQEEEKFDKVSKDVTKTNLFIDRIMSILNPSMMLIINIIILLIIWFGAKNISLGTLQIGDMMAYIQYTMQIMMSFLMVSMMFVFLPRATVAGNRVNEVLTMENFVKDKEDIKDFKVSDGTIEFKNVSFRYHDAIDDVLTGVTFTANKNEVTAFIGSTGSGKSTLVDLIPRFYDVSGGQILIDDVDIRDVPMKDLRDSIGYVPQKGVLFTGTISSNIKYGNKDISDKDLDLVSEISCSKEIINSKEEKYQSLISEGGVNVSGGQKQRLSIARALAKKAKIYIFDDSFSALDYKTESKVRKMINEHLKDKTILIVAQRVSSIMHADKIVVLDCGKVVGVGKHLDLMKTCDVYKEIALSQLSKEELA